MKVIKQQHNFMGIKWESTHGSQLGTWAYVAVGVFSAVVGYAGSAQTRKSNEKAAKDAAAGDAARRAMASEELGKAMASLNKMREERPGITFEQWKNEYVKAITDPVLAQNFRKIKQDDFDAASSFATQGTHGNVMNFLKARDVVSLEAAPDLTRQANEIALSSDTPSAMRRAMELRSGYIPSGTVQYDKEGRLIEGQRADKQVFTAAYEVDAANRDLSFRRAKDLLMDYSNIAERQSEKASSFLQFAGLEPVAREMSGSAMKAAIGFHQQDEQNQFDLIKTYANAMTGMTPTTPQFQSTAASDKLTSDGINAAIKGIAQYYGNNSSGAKAQNQSSYTPSYGSSSGDFLMPEGSSASGTEYMRNQNAFG